MELKRIRKRTPNLPRTKEISNQNSSMNEEELHQEEEQEEHHPVFVLEGDQEGTSSLEKGMFGQSSRELQRSHLLDLCVTESQDSTSNASDCGTWERDVDSALSSPSRPINTESTIEKVIEIHNYSSAVSSKAETGPLVQSLDNSITPSRTWSPSKKIGIEDFELISVIGKGAYGKVYLVRKKRNQHVSESPNVSSCESASETKEDQKNNLFAMKVLKKATIVVHGKGPEQTRNERSILQEVQHPFIVKLHYAFQTPLKLYLILSYAPGGELFGYLYKEKMFPEDTACFYISEILLALEHLHGLGIIYRDLKPENVLLNSDGHILLTDFGLSKVALTTATVCGTPEFTAPEILHEQNYDKTVDFWSLGVMLFDMLTGHPPWTGHNRKKIMEGILKKKPQFPKYITPQAKDLCTKLLKKVPYQRLGHKEGTSEIKKHSFFRKIIWDKLLAKELSVPFLPTIHYPEDTSHFDQDFTTMPLESPPPMDDLLTPFQSHNPHPDAFLGFSYEDASQLANK